MDVATLFLIIGVFFYIRLVKKQPIKKGELRYVYFQLAILFVAQVLYTIRSTTRIAENDDSYFGNKSPEWTKTCERMGNIANYIQHWMYTSTYFKVGLVFRLTFAKQSHYNVEKRHNRMKILNRINGLIYMILVAGFFIQIFITGYYAMNMVYAVSTFVMIALLMYSYFRVHRYLKILEPKGIQMMATLPTVQIICITAIAMLNFVAYFSDIRFEKDCEEGGSDTIGIVSRAMNMVILLLWRITNITFVIVFIRHASEVKK